MCAAHLLGIGPDGALQGQGSVTGAQGVIRVGNGCPGEGHNAIVKHLIHRALVAVHGVHHNVASRVQQLLGGFRIKALDESGGVFDGGEEDGDLLAFACEGAFGSQNLLEQMLGCVGLWRCEPRRWQTGCTATGCPHSRQNFTPLPTRCYTGHMSVPDGHHAPDKILPAADCLVGTGGSPHTRGSASRLRPGTGGDCGSDSSLLPTASQKGEETTSDGSFDLAYDVPQVRWSTLPRLLFRSNMHVVWEGGKPGIVPGIISTVPDFSTRGLPVVTKLLPGNLTTASPLYLLGEEKRRTIDKIDRTLEIRDCNFSDSVAGISSHYVAVSHSNAWEPREGQLCRK